ncbi:MAG TPA: pantoate--beta-alanine ligase [Chitinophagales bacterium]
MIIVETLQDLDLHISNFKKVGKFVGFAPTMGALHEGHLSLIRKAKRECDAVVCSIFVNPTQFNNAEDLAKYPITKEQDESMLRKAKCDILFRPNVKEMYPENFKNLHKIDFGFLAETLEGEFRPGHFDGMAQIVEKLVRAVNCDVLYMGQKDFQQAAIVGKMLQVLKMDVKLVICPIIREKDGLAMSSRNVQLDAKAKKTALELSKTLRYLKRLIQTSDTLLPKEIIEKGQTRLAKFPEITVEYLAWRKIDSLKSFTKRPQINASVLLVAAWVGGVRLIDNVLV